MRLVASLSAALITAAFAAPGLAMSDDTLRLAQAAPAGPPTSGWNAPGAAPKPQAGPPTSGWGAPAASPKAAPAPPGAGWSAPGAPASAPGAPPPGTWSGGGAASGRNCMGEIQPLLADAEVKGKAIQAAAKSKQQPVVCQAFRNLAAAEAKLIKYFDDHGAECRIPPDATKARKGNYAKIIEIRTKVCDTAAAPAQRAPSLSDALGTSRIPSLPSESAPAAKRGSTFDTLTGNPLAR